MSLTRIELLTVKADDGLASGAEMAELVAAGVVVGGWKATRSVLQQALAAPVPELVDDVLSTLELTQTGLSRDVIARSMAPEEHPDLVDGVLAALELHEDIDVHAALQHTVADDVPELADDVLSALALHEDVDLSHSIQDTLRAEHSPDLVDGVLRELALAEPADSTAFIRESLTGDHTAEPPDLVAGIFAELGLQETQSPDLRDALASRGQPPELAAAVMDEVGEGTSVGDAVRAAFSAEQPELWDGIAAELEISTAVGEHLREASQHETPELWSGVAAALDLEIADTPVSSEPPEGQVVPFRSWVSGGLGVVLAVAAAALLMVVSTHPEQSALESVFDVASVVDNTAAIEELESSPDAVVQFFQTEDGAPTILYINELEPVDTGVQEGEQP